MLGIHRAVVFSLLLLAGLAALAGSGPAEVMRIVQAPSGLWAAGYGKGVWHYTGGQWRQTANGETLRYATDLAVGPGGKLYIATWMGEGIAVLDPRTGKSRTIGWPEKMPGFNRGNTRATRIVYDGRNIIVNTFAGIGRLDPAERWTFWGGQTEMELLFADGTGCWTVMNYDLIHITRAGVVDRKVSLNGFLKEDMRLTGLWVDATHALIGDKRGILYSLRLRDGQAVTVAGPPAGIRGALLEILPAGQTIYLAYGTPGFPGGGKAGGLGLYDRLTGHITAPDALRGQDRRTLLLAQGRLWIGGPGGIQQLALPHAVPSIARVDGKRTILLPDVMRAALKRYDPAFTPCPESHFMPSLLAHYDYTNRQAPFAAIGDFNGDGRQDVVVQGHTKEDFVTLVIFAGKSGAQVVELSRGDQPNVIDPGDEGHFMCLEFVPRGTHRSHWEPKPLVLTTDAFSIIGYEKAASICYYRNGRFNDYVTAD